MLHEDKIVPVAKHCCFALHVSLYIEHVDENKLFRHWHFYIVVFILAYMWHIRCCLFILNSCGDYSMNVTWYECSHHRLRASFMMLHLQIDCGIDVLCRRLCLCTDFNVWLSTSDATDFWLMFIQKEICAWRSCMFNWLFSSSIY